MQYNGKLAAYFRKKRMQLSTDGPEYVLKYTKKVPNVGKVTAQLIFSFRGNEVYHPRGLSQPYAVGCGCFDRRSNCSIRYLPKTDQDWMDVFEYFSTLLDSQESYQKCSQMQGDPRFVEF